MTDQETHDRTLDEARPPAPTVPDEEYYRREPAPRRTGRWSGLGIALVLVGLLLLASQMFGRGIGFASVGGAITLVDQTLPGNRIELSATASDVTVRAWDGPGIHVEATQRGGSRGDYNVDISRSGDTVRVTESARGFFWCLFCARGLSYQISVPANAQADIHTASGEIDVEGLSGAVSLGTTSGDVRGEDLSGGLTVGTSSGEVRLQDVSGKLYATTISGDVRLEDGKIAGATVKTTSGQVELDGVAGALDLGTVSGDITVQDARDSQLAVSTTSGDFEYTGALARGSTNEVSSISGDVQLRLPGDSDFRLDASTVSGDLHSEFDLSGGETGRRTLTGVTGDGSATLNVNTTSGGISIKRR